ncbi:YadA-like family protein [uncultured Neisseria sp.]|uniref:YadA-like family protein n=1 Tax=uncultured Neisseria sp. TaxID=237778 RepID=UPI00261731BA|nr:YadA-like family protein [uncultured Neisseria sp.]
MNKIFKIVWNRTIQSFVVTSELAKGHVKASSTVGGAAEEVRAVEQGRLKALFRLTALSMALLGMSEGVWATITERPATGGATFAIGNGTTSAHGSGAVAIGNNAQASNNGALAIGPNSGTSSTIAASNNSTAIGVNIKATGQKAITIGADTSVNGQGSIGIGSNDAGRAAALGVQGTKSIGIGTHVLVRGDNIIAVGADVVANKNNTVAIGYATQATAEQTVAIGSETKAEAQNAVVIGNRASVNADTAPADPNVSGTTTGAGSVAIGALSTASGTNATAIGQTSNAYGQNSFSGGQNSQATGKSSVALGDGAMAKGNSSVAVGPYSQAPALGAATLGFNNRATGENSLAVGRQANAAKANAIALGNEAKSLGEDAVAVGNNANAAQNRAMAFGKNSQALAGDAIAMGDSTVASGQNALAFGKSNKAEGKDAIAIGTNNNAWKVDSIAFGRSANADGEQAVAIGLNSHARQANAVALGQGANANDTNALAIGTSSMAEQAAAIAIGNNARASKYSSIVIGEGAHSNNSRSVVIGYNASAINPADSASNQDTNQTVAIGAFANAWGDQSTAIGNNVTAKGNSSIVIGSDDWDTVAEKQVEDGSGKTVKEIYREYTGDEMATGKNSYIQPTSGEAAVAIGTKSQATGELSTAFGTGTSATGLASAAFGMGARATKGNAVAIGAGSTTETDATGVRDANVNGVQYGNFAGGSRIIAGDQVSFGSAGYERQLKHIAPGAISETSTDAINGSQLYSVANVLATKIADASVKYYSVNPTEQDNTEGNRANDGATGTNAMAAGVAAAAAGDFSVAAGSNARANGHETVAIGHNTLASGVSAVAVGQRANASGSEAVALGIDSNASGKFAIAIGNKATVSDSKLNGIAIGSGAVAAENYAMSMGLDTKALGNSSIAFGNTAQATDSEALAIGHSAGALGANTVAFGVSATSNAAGAATVGAYTKAEAVNSTALGYASQAVNENDVALGAGSVTEAPHAGEYTLSNSYTAAGKDSYGVVSVGKAVGTKRQIQNVAAGVLSADSTDAVNGSQLYATNSYLLNLATATKNALGGETAVDGAGNLTVNNLGGTNQNTVHDALAALKTTADAANAAADKANTAIDGLNTSVGDIRNSINSLNQSVNTAKHHFYSVKNTDSTKGNYNNDGATGENALAAGVDALAEGNNAVAIGQNVKAKGDQSISIGSTNEASGESSTVIGRRGFVSGTNTHVLGNGNGAQGAPIAATQSTIIGNDNSINAVTNVHIQGNSNTVNRTHAIVMGSRNTVGGTGADNEEPAIAIGSENKVSISTDGSNTNTNASNAIAIGKQNIANGDSSIAIGKLSQALKLSTVAIGNSAKALENNALAVGSYSKAGDYATAIGSTANAFGAQSVALGTGTLSGIRASTIGRYSAAHADSSVAIGSDSLVTQNAHASTAFGSGSVVSGAYSGVWSGAIQNAGTGARADRNVEARSVIGGTGNYAIGNKNIVGSQTSDTFVLGNDVKIGASAATLTTANWAANPSRDLPRSDTVTFAGEKNITGAVALGSGTSVTVSDGVALGRASKASVDKGAVGADPLGSAADKTIAAWKSTRAAVSVGDAEGNITRQITSLAAGTQDTDAVNVAQLKSAGFKLQTSQSEGEVAGSNVENVQNGETVTVDAGKNIKLTQAENKITVATKDEVAFNKVTVGDTVVDGRGVNITSAGGNSASLTSDGLRVGDVAVAAAGINAGNKAITNVAAGRVDANSTDAVNGSQLYSTQASLDNMGKTVAGVLGGNAKLNADGGITMSNIGGTGASTIEGAISALNTGAYKSFKLVTAATSGTNGQANNHSLKEITSGSTITLEAGKNIVLNQNESTVSINTADAPEFSGVVKAKGGLDMADNKITNVGRGDSATDAVNLGQLTDALNNLRVSTLTTVNNDAPFSYIGSDGKILNRKVDVDPHTGVKTVSFVHAEDGTPYTDTSNITIAALNPTDPQTSTPTALGNIKAGTKQNDAVNVAQLDKLAKAAGTKVNPDGTITAPSYTVISGSPATAGVTTYDSADKAFSALSDAVRSPLNFAGDTGATATKQLGSTVTVKGGETDTDKLSDNNIGVVSDGQGTLDVKLAKALKGLDSAAFTDTSGNTTTVNAAGVTVGTAANPVKLTSDGLSNGGKTITSVAAGKNDTDAANVSQLKPLAAALGAAFSNADGSIAAPTFNVTKSDGSSVAANTVQGALDNIGIELQKGLNITADKSNLANSETKDHVKPGEVVLYTSVDKNIVTTVSDNQIDFGLADKITVGKNAAKPITIDGTSGKISGLGDNLTTVAAGDASAAKPANINGSNAATVNDVLNAGWNLQGNSEAKDVVTAYDTVNFANGTGTTVSVESANGVSTVKVSVDAQNLAETAQHPVVYTDASGNRVYKQQDGSFRTGPNGQGNEIADTNVIASLQNAAGSTIDPFKLANVAEGKVAAGSKEAVNGSQLYNAAAKTAEVLGGSVDNDGNLVAPAYALVDGTPAEGKPAKTYNNVGTALNALNTAVTSPLTFGGDNDTANFERKLGSRVFVKGGADAAELSEGNIGVVSNGSDTLNVKLAKELKELASAEFKDADGNTGKISANGVTVTPSAASGKQPVSLTSDGLNNGGNKISKVAKGEADDDAVNKAQLDAAAAAATSKVASGHDNIVVETVNNSDGSTTYKVATAKDLKADSVTAGNTVLNNDGVKVGSDVALTSDGLKAGDVGVTAVGINAGNKAITNVAAGVNDTDAVNLGQLKQQLDASEKTTTVAAGKNVTVSSKVEGNNTEYTVNADKTTLSQAAGGAVKVNAGEKDGDGVTDYALDLTDEAKEDIAKGVAAKEAVDNKGLTFAGDSGSTGAKKLGDSLTVKGDDNITTKADADGISVALNKTLTNLSSATFANVLGGNTVINGSGMTITSADGKQPVSLTSDGLNNGGNRISKVAKGVEADDAVNKAQLDAAAAAATSKVASGHDNIVVETVNNSDGSTTYKVATAKDLKADSVTAGDTVLNNDGVKVGNDVALTSDGLKAGDVGVTAAGINAGNKAVTNVAAGVNDTDAVNVSQLNQKAAAAKTEVAGGTNIASVTSSQGGNGQTIYTVNADGASVSAGSSDIVVAKGAKDGNNVTDYAVDLAQNVKADIAKGAAAKDIVDTKGLTFTGDSGSTGAKKLGDSVAVKGDANITTKADAAGVQVSLNKDLNVNSVTAGNTVVDNGGVTVGSGNNAVSLTSGGLNNGGNKVTNVAAGTVSADSKDAVNGGQLHQLYQLIGSNGENHSTTKPTTDSSTGTSNVGNIKGITLVDNSQNGNVKNVTNQTTVAQSNGYTLVTYNVEGKGMYVTNDVIEAVGRINEQGIRFFHTNDGEVDPAVQATNTEDSSASGAYSTAVGYQAQASASDTLAIGRQSVSSGMNAIAIGKGAQANAENTIAIGTGNIVSGKASGAIGDPSVVTGNSSYSVGNNNTVSANNAYALGSNITAGTADSVYLGDRATTSGVHTANTASGEAYTYGGLNDAAVAGKAGSSATANKVAGVVTVGNNADETRQVQGVAAGVVSAASTDAINGSQLYYTNQAINQSINSINNYVANMGNQLNQRINDVESDSKAGTAAAMAVAGLPQAYLPGKSMMAVSGSAYRGESGYAVGFSSISDGGNWIIKGTATGNSRGHYGATAGVGYQW